MKPPFSIDDFGINHYSGALHWLHWEADRENEFIKMNSISFDLVAAAPKQTEAFFAYLDSHAYKGVYYYGSRIFKSLKAMFGSKSGIFASCDKYVGCTEETMHSIREYCEPIVEMDL